MIQAINGTYLTYELEDNYVKNSRNAGVYLERIKEINILPFSNLKLFFSDNTWDFSSTRNVNIKKSSMIFRFEHTCEQYRDELKKYILSKLLDGYMKIQSINNEVFTVSRFLNYAFELSYFNVNQFDTILITNFMRKLDGLSKSYRRQNANSIRSFLSYYSTHYENVLTPEIEALLEYRQYIMSPEEKEKRKVSDIPKHYYDGFFKAAITIVNSNDAPLRIKAGTCILLILSQTGLRISELLDLRCGALNKTASYSGKELFYLSYRTWKREQGNNVFVTEKIFANDITIQAYKTLVELYREERLLLGCEYLYLGNPRKRDIHNLPISNDQFSYTYKEVFAYMDRYFPTINIPAEQQTGLSTCSLKTFSRDRYPNAETLTYPTTVQFRVHVCSELYSRGCPLQYIQRFMGHLSNEMTGYYVRTDPHNSQEDLEYAQKVFRSIVTNDIQLLGSGADNIKANIDKFIRENGFRIEHDMDTIISILTDKMPIRQKTGGICIRSSSIRECSKDAMTNEFYCAYGVCPNIFHFFYMAEVSYRQASELYKGISLNCERGFMRQAYKESLMLHTLAEQKLIPELDELKKEIDKKGYQAIIIEYPDLEHIVLHLDSICEEASAWKSYSV